jgi:transposase-like protein
LRGDDLHELQQSLRRRRRRVIRRARSGSGSHDDLALGSTYAPELEQRLRPELKPSNKSWRVDETYIRIQGRWCYLYRAIDSTGATIDSLLSALRDAAAAKRLFRQALSDSSRPQPRVINTDQARLYGAAIAAVKAEGILRRRCRHRPVQYLNNILEQDHRAIKHRVKAKQSFREFHAARRTIAGYKAIHMIRKGRCAGSATMMSANRIGSSTGCSIWLPETSPPFFIRASSHHRFQSCNTSVKNHSLIDAGSACDHTGSRSRKALCGEFFESSGHEFLPGSIQVALFSHCSPSAVCVLFFSVPHPCGATFALPLASTMDALPTSGQACEPGQAVIDQTPICEAGLKPEAAFCACRVQRSVQDGGSLRARVPQSTQREQGCLWTSMVPTGAP